MWKQGKRKSKNGKNGAASPESYLDLGEDNLAKLRAMHEAQETLPRTESDLEDPPGYRSYALNNYRELPQVARLSDEAQASVSSVKLKRSARAPSTVRDRSLSSSSSLSFSSKTSFL